MEHQYIIAHADKSVLKISGLTVKGLNTLQIEELLAAKLKTAVRVIGVTGESIEMDVYQIEPEKIRRDQKGIIEAVALAEGISLTDMTKMVCGDKIVEVDYGAIPDQPISACARERWMKWK